MASNYRTTRSTSRIAAANELAASSSSIFDSQDVENSTPRASAAMVATQIKQIHEIESSNDGCTSRPTKRKRKQYDTSAPRKAAKSAFPRKTAAAGVITLPGQQPENWRTVYDTIKEMRSHFTAPADTMGCEQSKHKENDPKVCCLSLSTLISCLRDEEQQIHDTCVSHAVFSD